MTTATLPARHRKATPGITRRVPRVLSGLVLALVALGATTAAVLTAVLHLGFAPVLRVGDVVILPRPDAPTERYAHRVISINLSSADPVVRTKGDANESADPQPLRITSADVPVAVGHIPAVGRIALMGQYVWARLAVIVLIGLCLLVAAKRLLWDRAR